MTVRLNHRRIALCCSLSVLVASSVHGQEELPATTPAPVASTQTDTATDRSASTDSRRGGGGAVMSQGKLVLNFKDASIDVVLDELSAVAGYVIVKEVRTEGRVTLVSRQPLNAEDAVSLLNTVLRNAGYSAIAQGRILKIVSRDKARRLNIPVRSGADPTKIEPTDELITQVIPLRYADATQLKSDLQPLMNPEADFTANASSNALVVTDTSANIRRIVQIVAALDTSVADASEVKVFQLQYANATNAAKLINEVFGTQGSGSRSNNQQQQFPFFMRQFMGGGGFGGGQGGGGPGGGGQGGGAGGNNTTQGGRRGATISASADERTNTVVVTGPVDILRVVERVVKEIDANPAAEQSVLIYNLKNAQAVNLESVLNNLFNSTTTSSTTRQTTNSTRNSVGNNSRAFGGGAGSTSSGNRGASGSSGPASSGTLGLSRNNNSTFGSGFGSSPNISSNAQRAASDLAGDVSIIADPDTNSLLVRTAPKNFERVKQVISELDRPVAQVLIKVLIAEVTHKNDVDLGVEFSALNLRPSGLGTTGGTDFGLKSATGGLKVSVLEANFETTIRALQTIGKVDVLSRPYILASDNQLASITVGEEVPFITSSRITDTGQTINTVEYGDVGILLDVVPHINPEGLVILDVSPEISARTTSTVDITETVKATVFSKRSAQSRVGVRNGQTVVIGGLMEDKSSSTVDQVPLLGDIPILGELFKRRRPSSSKTELLIFLTPQVAPKPELLKEMAEDELRGTKLTPDAVRPGAFKEHMHGMNRAATPTTQPAP